MRPKDRYARKPPSKPRPLSQDDVLDQEAIDAARRMVGPIVKELLAAYPHRPLDTLDKLAWDKILIAAISGWIVKRTEQKAAILLDDPVDDLHRDNTALLLA